MARGVVVPIKVMGEEWEAWQLICKHFTELGMNVNDKRHNRLMKAICQWGEHLGRLRVYQSVATRHKAFREAVDAYQREVKKEKRR